MFGFIQMVPQLIINYKLKSVAHSKSASAITTITIFGELTFPLSANEDYDLQVPQHHR